MDQDRIIETFTIDWQGIILSVSYEVDWLNMGDKGRYRTAHLQVYSVKPERAQLAITETGYRSHFLCRDDIDAAGGPVAYALAWLDHGAKSPQWCAQQEAGRQLSLF